jgi:hypothetical protein
MDLNASAVALALKGGNAKMSTNRNGWNDRGLAHPDDVFGVLPGETSATVCRRDARECVEIEIERDYLKEKLEQMSKALEFIQSICAEELLYAKVGTGAEVALRHAERRASEALGDEK